MARIAGFLQPNQRELSPSIIEKMAGCSSVLVNTPSVFSKEPPFFSVWRGQNQPGIYHGRSIRVLLDGTIYNSKEIDREVADAQLIGELYLSNGFENAIRKLNGDFAIVLYDLEKKQLWLARDRFGIRPLYYGQVGKALVFASTPWPILSFPGVSNEENPSFIGLYAGSNYRTFNFDSQISTYKGIYQLPQAHFALYSEGKLSLNRFWNLQPHADWTDSEDNLASRYAELLEESVRIRLNKTDRPAFTLSGGMDSSSVISLTNKITGQRQHAFSTVYDDQNFDESTEIKSILPSCVEEWHPLRVEPKDLISELQSAIRVNNAPILTSNYLSHYLLCEEVSSKGFTHIFGGLGGDELNAGEFDHFFYFFADLLRTQNLTRFESEAAGWEKFHDHPIFRKNRGVIESKLSKLVDLSVPGRCLEDRTRVNHYQNVLNPDYFRLDNVHFPVEHRFDSYLKNRTFQEIVKETIPPCVAGEDRNSNYFNVPNILPFFDHRVVEFMFRVPVTFLFDNGLTKRLLRKAMIGIVPEETRTRVKKVGWNAPAHQWFNTMGLDILFDIIHSQTFKNRGIYNIPEVEHIITEHKAIIDSNVPRENHMMFLWQLLNLHLWFELSKELKSNHDA